MTKILLVEDDKSLREIYGVRLLAEGYDIVSAGDGEEALAMAIKERPQLIVSDVMMPKISGFDMLDILRSTTETKNIKVIMMTALSSEDQRQRGVALGADRYLVKSQVGIEDVVRTVHEVLEDKNPPTPSATTAAPATGADPSTVAAAPVAPVAPEAPAPTTMPPAAAPAAAPTAEPVAPAATPLPQPTAPFSTPRPSNLGDRVIQPLESNPATEKDYSSLMDVELTKAATETLGSSPLPPEATMPTPSELPPAPVFNAPPLSAAPVAQTTEQATEPTLPAAAPEDIIGTAPSPIAPAAPVATSIPVSSTDEGPDPLADSQSLKDQASATAAPAPTPLMPDAPLQPTEPTAEEAPATSVPQLPTDFVPPEFEETNPARPPQQ